MSVPVVSADPATAVAATQAKMDAVQTFLWHHILDSNQWTVFGHVGFPLPGFLTVHGVMVIFCALLVILLFCVAYRKSAPVPRGLTNLLELFVIFIRDQVSTPFLGKEMGEKMTPLRQPKSIDSSTGSSTKVEPSPFLYVNAPSL